MQVIRIEKNRCMTRGNQLPNLLHDFSPIHVKKTHNFFQVKRNHEINIMYHRS